MEAGMHLCSGFFQSGAQLGSFQKNFFQFYLLSEGAFFKK
jgi:hypothetical protein